MVLLGMKKRGFGEGKWNGFGGKVELGETIIEAACREVKEECGLVVLPENMEKMGEMDFVFKGDPVVLNVHVFQSRLFSGEMIETEEMKPMWFREDNIPYKDMWLDDELWYPHLLENRKFQAHFVFEGHDKILQSKIELI